jgi:dihydrofolate synthase/folylpolyglutamate synthase
MNYHESLRALTSLGRELGAPQHARLQTFGIENIAILSEELGAPHRAAPCVHIAGTNGKGSTAAILDSILRASGVRTGLYTSPHLERINERIRIDGVDISDAEFGAIWTEVQSAIERLLAAGKLVSHPTFFECVTAMGYLAFARHHVDFAIYEVGMGGRLDSTNIVQPEVAVITPIDFDHESFLGHSLQEIAGEKAGIIKEGATVVTSAQRPEAGAVIARRCEERKAKLFELAEFWRIGPIEARGGLYRTSAFAVRQKRSIPIEPSLPGRFQIHNALAAATTSVLLAERGFSITDEAIARGIAAARWPGRLERLSDQPALYLDGTHNSSGARELAAFWHENFAGRRVIVVYGAVRDKPVDEIAGILFPAAETVIFTEPRQSRAISPATLAEMTGHFARRSRVIANPFQALEAALEMASPEDVIFVTGSLYLVGDLRGYWSKRADSHAGPRSIVVR